MNDKYSLNDESEDKYFKYLMKRYGKKRASEFLEDTDFINT